MNEFPEIPEDDAAPEGPVASEILVAVSEDALEAEVIRVLTEPGSTERRHHLCKIGALPQEVRSIREMKRYISSIFSAFQALDPEEEQTADSRRKYQELTNLLGVSGIAVPITFRDWKVDRTTEAEQRWGLNEGGTAILEELLVEEYVEEGQAKPVHLHKGPGNGELMNQLSSTSGHMEEVGVGDRLYFTIESALTRYMRPELLEDEAAKHTVFILAQALQSALHNKWFEPIRDENNVVQRWRLKVPYCDLNNIFSLLSDPQGWLPKIYKRMMKAQYRASVEFEDDEVYQVPHEAQEFMVQFADCEFDYRQAQSQRLKTLHKKVVGLENAEEDRMKEYREEYWRITGNNTPDACTPNVLTEVIRDDILKMREEMLDRQESRMQASPLREVIEAKKRLDARISRLFSLKAKISKLDGTDDTNEWLEEFRDIAGPRILEGMEVGEENLSEAIKLLIPLLIEASKELKRQIADSEDVAQEGQSHVQQTEASAGKLSKIFTDEFVQAICDHTRYEDPEYRLHGLPLDLNRSGPVMHFRRFIPGKFVETLSELPTESCLCITSSRGDSHESSTPIEEHSRGTIHLQDSPGEFEQDIGLTIDRLMPGGVFLTDGHRQSFSRIDRFEEIMRVAGGRDDVRVILVIDKQTHVPRSVAIQKRHPEKGYLSESDLTLPFNENEVYFAPFESAMHLRPDLIVERIIRRQIYLLADGDPQVFKHYQQHIRDCIEYWMSRITTGVLARNPESVDSKLMELVRGRICEVLQQKGTPTGHYGSHLEIPMQVSHVDLERAGFLELTDILMRKCGARTNPPEEVHQLYEQELFRAMAARVFNYYRAIDGDQDEPLSDDEFSEWEGEAFQYARNILLSDEPILDKSDIDSIVMKVGQDLRAIVQKSKKVDREFTVGSGLEALRPGRLHVLPRLGSAITTKINAHHEFPIENLPTNAEFATKDLLELHERNRRLTLQRLSSIMRIRGEGAGAPIQLIVFRDCAVNKCLGEALDRFLGEENTKKYVSVIENLGFDSGKDVASLRDHYEQHSKARLEECCASGVVFIVGGSWYNPDDEYGRFFQETYAGRIHEAIKGKGISSRGLFICFGHQNEMEVLGREHREKIPGLGTGPGSLEFCPTPVHVTEPGHPIFKGMPKDFVVMNTHGVHVHGLNNVPDKMRHIVRPIANSSLTGLPVACDIYNGRAIGLQVHPEVILHGDKAHGEEGSNREQIMREVRRIEGDLQETFGIGADRLDSMWREASDHLEANAGDIVFGSALHHLVEGLPRGVRRGSRAAAPHGGRRRRSRRG